MKIYTHLQLGDFHPVFCEDFLFHTAIDEQFYMAAVMDGCSTAKDSHFAAVLFAKIWAKLIQLLPYQSILKNNIDLKKIGTKELTIYLLQQFFKEAEQVKNLLLLDTEELLATLILLIYHQERQDVFIVALGDGVVVIDGEIVEIDQNNRPAYPAFYLGQVNLEQLDLAQIKAHTFYKKMVKDVSIATDGVVSFLPIQNNSKPLLTSPLFYLLAETSFLENELMLHKKCLVLEQEFGVKASDDMAIVRLVL